LGGPTAKRSFKMNRRQFLETAGIAAGGLALGTRACGPNFPKSQTEHRGKMPFVTRGIYFHDGFTVEPKS